MGILSGKRILVAGVLTDASISFHVARLAQQEGATVVLTAYPRLSLVQRIAKRLPEPAPVLELDVTNEEQLGSLADRVREHVDGLDGVVHGIAFGPATALGGNFLQTPWPDAATALQVSAFSLKSLAMAALPLMRPGGAIVGMDFDATVAWPAYDWMGVAKAALESTARYLARDLGPQGIRVNLMSAGPVNGRQEHPRLRPVRGRLGRPRAARLGPEQCRASGPRLRGAAIGLVPGDDRRDRARRWRRARDGRLTGTRTGTRPSPPRLSPARGLLSSQARPA